MKTSEGGVIPRFIDSFNLSFGVIVQGVELLGRPTQRRTRNVGRQPACSRERRFASDWLSHSDQRSPCGLNQHWRSRPILEESLSTLH
jgi:hypothetical protein